MSNKKPIIGVTPLFDIAKNSIWMLPDYENAVLKAGGIPMILPLTDDDCVISQIAQTIDGLLVTGGQDVNPSLYGEEKKEYCGEICESRDVFEIKITKEITKLDKPVLGICRGLQVINVCFGGTLYQDLNKEFGCDIVHRMEGPNDRPWHSVTISEGCILNSVLGEKADVNSCHHQGIKKLGDSLKATAFSSDGLIEGIERPSSKFFIAVQWHPERLYKNMNEEFEIFRRFVSES